VDYTGVPVKEGDHLVYLYSPELISAQEELLQALDAVKNVQDTQLSVMREMTESTVGSGIHDCLISGHCLQRHHQLHRSNPE
jgi:Cu(I)/Ag(I) efflux system membrane fusion protein